MSIHNFAMSNVAGSSAQGGGFYPYLIDQSLRFDRNSSSYLTRTPSSAGNRKTFTLSFWYKNCDNTNDQIIWGSRIGSNDQFQLHKNTSSGLDFYNQTGGSITVRMITSSVFRDVSAWYHIVLKVDVTTGTSANAIYVNGVEQPLTTDTSSNTDTYVNSTIPHQIGRWDTGGYINAYMTEINFIDGTALDATSFGETKEGVWVPKEYDTADGAYGTNGFYLSFADSGAIGDDLSGNTNDFTVNNLSAHDVGPDSPTNNFATINATHRHFNMTFKEGNLRHETSTNNRGVVGNFLLPKSGKWYWEHWSKSFHLASANEAHFVGINITDPNLDGSDRGGRNTGVSISSLNGNVFNESSTGTSYGSGWAENQGVAVLFDADAATISFSENGGAFGSAVSIASGTTNKDWIPFVGMGGGTSNEVGVFNFGQDGTFAGETTSGNYTDANGIGNFKWQPPADALALCSANLPEVTIGPNSAEQADNYFNIALYQSNGGLNTITGLGHQPDFLWIKQRDSTNSHAFTDSVRGPTKALTSNSTDSEYTYTNGLQSFDSDGFTLNGNNGWYNSTTLRNYVAWSWKAGGSSNTFNIDGTDYATASAASLDGGDITPTGASISTAAGFSILTYTGNGSTNQTMKHGLLQAPQLTIIKDRDTNSNNNQWWVSSTIVGDDYFYLSTTAAATGIAITYPTSGDDTTLTIQRNTPVANNNESGDRFVMYNFHSVDGYCKVGSYVGNGNADGAFVYTGFRPAWIMMKRTSSTGNWTIMDSARDTFNVLGERLYANLSNAGSDGTIVDFLSNGFKFRVTANDQNGSGSTYIYLAFAESPFKYSNAR